MLFIIIRFPVFYVRKGLYLWSNMRMRTLFFFCAGKDKIHCLFQTFLPRMAGQHVINWMRVSFKDLWIHCYNYKTPPVTTSHQSPGAVIGAWVLFWKTKPKKTVKKKKFNHICVWKLESNPSLPLSQFNLHNV